MNTQPEQIIKLPPIHTTNINTNIDTNNEYTLYFDGCSKGNPGVSGTGSVIYNNEDEIWSKSTYIGIKTNNQSEYQSLIIGLQEALKLNIQNISVFGDSLLVIQQTKGIYRVKNENLIELHETVNKLKTKFKNVTFTHIYRNKNKRADKLANMALDNLQYKYDYELNIKEIK